MEDPSRLKRQAVPFVVQDRGGRAGTSTSMRTDGQTVTPPKKRQGGAARTRTAASSDPCPQPHGNSANSQGFARFFVDIAAARAAGGGARRKTVKRKSASRDDFLEADRPARPRPSNDPALKAVQSFRSTGWPRTRRFADAGPCATVTAKEVRFRRPRAPSPGYPDGRDDDLRSDLPSANGIARFFAGYTGRRSRATRRPRRLLHQVTGTVGPLPVDASPLNCRGIPGGLPTGVSIVSFRQSRPSQQLRPRRRRQRRHRLRCRRRLRCARFQRADRRGPEAEFRLAVVHRRRRPYSSSGPVSRRGGDFIRALRRLQRRAGARRCWKRRSKRPFHRRDRRGRQRFLSVGDLRQRGAGGRARLPRTAAARVPSVSEPSDRWFDDLSHRRRQSKEFQGQLELTLFPLSDAGQRDRAGIRPRRPRRRTAALDARRPHRRRRCPIRSSPPASRRLARGGGRRLSRPSRHRR